MKLILSLILVGVLVVLASLVVCRPAAIGDGNRFLREFVNHELLTILGVILSITLASISNIHLYLNRLEERANMRTFQSARRELVQAACWLIGLFILAVLLVLIKPAVTASEIGTATFNAGALAVLAFYILILLDVTIAVFEIKPDIQDSEPPVD